MMEDQITKEVPVDDSQQDEPPPVTGKMGSVLAAGWRLGKKAALAGVAISSAPVVLPPLIIFSALGLAFSVPFGLVLAGYACNQGVMSYLLPSPPAEEVESMEEGGVEEEKEKGEGLGSDNQSADFSANVGYSGVQKEAREEEAEARIGRRGGGVLTSEDHDFPKRIESAGDANKDGEAAAESLSSPRREESAVLETATGGKSENGATDHTVSFSMPSGISVEVGESQPVDDEEFYSEEKIWQQIDALRIILGYKAELHPSFVEELKAVYAFTGVEPPASLDKSMNLVQATEKLRFLKSVVGVI